MLLAIDAGNTNTVFAIFDGETKLGVWRISTDSRRTADEYAVWLIQLMALDSLNRADVKRAIIASVVPEGLFNLVRLCEKFFGCTPLVVGDPLVELGIRAVIDRPEEVGADRLVNALSARVSFGAPVVVIDFGTATTFDLVDANGDYAGGLIAPGINLSLEALYMAAAKLPRVAIKKTQKVIATNTVTAMQAGVFWGYIGMIEGIVARMRAETGINLLTVATGGLAPMFADATDVISHTEGDLTLRGLMLIDRMNTNRSL
jgi:type III pantothenate kinase